MTVNKSTGRWSIDIPYGRDAAYGGFERARETRKDAQRQTTAPIRREYSVPDGFLGRMGRCGRELKKAVRMQYAVRSMREERRRATRGRLRRRGIGLHDEELKQVRGVRSRTMGAAAFLPATGKWSARDGGPPELKWKTHQGPKPSLGSPTCRFPAQNENEAVGACATGAENEAAEVREKSERVANQDPSVILGLQIPRVVAEMSREKEARRRTEIAAMRARLKDPILSWYDTERQIRRLEETPREHQAMVKRDGSIDNRAGTRSYTAYQTATTRDFGDINDPLPAGFSDIGPSRSTSAFALLFSAWVQSPSTIQHLPAMAHRFWPRYTPRRPCYFDDKICMETSTELRRHTPGEPQYSLPVRIACIPPTFCAIPPRRDLIPAAQGVLALFHIPNNDYALASHHDDDDEEVEERTLRMREALPTGTVLLAREVDITRRWNWFDAEEGVNAATEWVADLGNDVGVTNGDDLPGAGSAERTSRGLDDHEDNDVRIHLLREVVREVEERTRGTGRIADAQNLRAELSLQGIGGERLWRVASGGRRVGDVVWNKRGLLQTIFLLGAMEVGVVKKERARTRSKEAEFGEVRILPQVRVQSLDSTKFK
ncbi:hypothetical protein C8R44DRAFT_919773 [Mycena epipterygia]|nr:hypothetical protein C8R44DRAFT_919773 [Mycena epipterygia]